MVYTDHTPLKAMLKAKHPSGKLVRWAEIISELDVRIQYRPGRKNANANALEREEECVGEGGGKSDGWSGSSGVCGG